LPKSFRPTFSTSLKFPYQFLKVQTGQSPGVVSCKQVQLTYLSQSEKLKYFKKGFRSNIDSKPWLF
jgi:hypothetical protein